jgi:hypothetical protein
MTDPNSTPEPPAKLPDPPTHTEVDLTKSLPLSDIQTREDKSTRQR